MPLAAFLAWLVPGLGHFYLGHRARGGILFVTITATFWTGVLVGDVRATVDPANHRLWFLAEICTGGNTLVAVGVRRQMLAGQPSPGPNAYFAHYVPVDVGTHYAGVAGLLNLLIILDAIARADPSATRFAPTGPSRKKP